MHKSPILKYQAVVDMTFVQPYVKIVKYHIFTKTQYILLGQRTQ